MVSTVVGSSLARKENVSRQNAAGALDEDDAALEKCRLELLAILRQAEQLLSQLPAELVAQQIALLLPALEQSINGDDGLLFLGQGVRFEVGHHNGGNAEAMRRCMVAPPGKSGQIFCRISGPVHPDQNDLD